MILKLCRIHICVVIIFAWELELLIIMTIMTFMRMVCNQEAKLWYIYMICFNPGCCSASVFLIIFSQPYWSFAGILTPEYRSFAPTNFFDVVSVFTMMIVFYYPVWCFFSMVHCVAIFKALNERSVFVVVFSSFIWWICT